MNYIINIENNYLLMVSVIISDNLIITLKTDTDSDSNEKKWKQKSFDYNKNITENTNSGREGSEVLQWHTHILYCLLYTSRCV